MVAVSDRLQRWIAMGVGGVGMANGFAQLAVLEGAMPEISWLTMNRLNPAGHLVVGVVPTEGEVSGLKMRAALLSRVARALRLSGLYGIIDLPARSGNEIRCLLEQAVDAERLAKAVGASDDAPAPGSASRRRFVFDDKAISALQAIVQEMGSVTRHRRKSRTF